MSSGAYFFAMPSVYRIRVQPYQKGHNFLTPNLLYVEILFPCHNQSKVLDNTRSSQYLISFFSYTLWKSLGYNTEISL